MNAEELIGDTPTVTEKIREILEANFLLWHSDVYTEDGRIGAQ